MATEIVGKVSLDGSSIGNIRQQLKEATRELIAMQEQFGTTSDQAIAAAQKVAGLKDQIQDAREVADLFDPGKKFAAFSGVISGVAQGFTAVQGAMGLFGVESKELEQQLLRVQSAMALSQGLSGVLDAADKFKGFATVIKTQVVGAFKSLRGAIAATGIGLLVVALGTMVAYWEDIMRLMDGVSEEQENLNKAAAENTKAQQDKLTALEKSDAKLKASGKSEKEILQIKLNQTKQVIEAIKLEIERAKITKANQIAAAERNNKIMQGIVRFAMEASTMVFRAIAAPIDLLISTVNKASVALGQGELITFNINDQITKMNKGVSEFVALQVFDPKKTAAEGDANIKELEGNLADAENKFYTYQNNITDMNKKGGKQRTDDTKKELEEQRKARLAEREKTEQDLENLLQKYREKEQDAAAKTEAQKIQLERQRALDELMRLNGDAAAKLQIERYYQNELKKLREKETQDSLKNVVTAGNASVQRLQADEARKAEIRKKALEDDMAINEARMASEQALLQNVGSAISALGGLFREGTAASKASALAELAINTGLGFANGLRIAQQSAAGTGPAAAFAFPIFYAQQIAAVLKAVGQARNILKTVRGGGGTGVSPSAAGVSTGAPMQPSVPIGTQLQLQNQQAINAMGNQAARAYILNSDLQNNQQINQYLQRNASIG